MGALTDAKACFIEIDQGEVTIKVNGVAQPLPLTATSGFWIYFNPDGGLTDLTVSSLANAKIRAYIFT